MLEDMSMSLRSAFRIKVRKKKRRREKEGKEGEE